MEFGRIRYGYWRYGRDIRFEESDIWTGFETENLLSDLRCGTSPSIGQLQRFYLIIITVEPRRVIRTGPGTVQLRCFWRDYEDKDISSYTCQFYLRDNQGTIYGPFESTVSKIASTEYCGTFVFDPDETYPLGYYDVKVVVIKS
jgi:hypothetical protein